MGRGWAVLGLNRVQPKGWVVRTMGNAEGLPREACAQP